MLKTLDLANQNLEIYVRLESISDFQSIPHMFVCIGFITENPLRYLVVHLRHNDSIEVTLELIVKSALG